jgi:hypothetical protein
MSENIFKEYGFEQPTFKCKLYDKIDDITYGVYFNPNKQSWTQCRWDSNGINKQGSSLYQLKPIKKEWYETCKFPLLVRDHNNRIKVAVAVEFLGTCVYEMSNTGKVFSWEDLNKVTPLTDDEIESLKQGF